MYAIYARVSTEDQARTGYSLDDQLETGFKYYQQKGINKDEIEIFIEEGKSGEFLDRPELQRLRDKVFLKQVKEVWILDPDRLSRDDIHAFMLKVEIEKSAKLTFHTGNYDKTPEGDLFFKVRASIASFEKAKIRERTMRGKRQKALSGKIISNRPMYGYDWNEAISNYDINNDESAVIKEIYNLCINKKYGLYRIVNLLNSKGLKNKRNNNWNIKNVYRILTEPIYTGTYYLFKEQWKKTGQKTYDVTKIPKDSWIRITVPAIVTTDEQASAKKQLTLNCKNSPRNKRKDYLLTGIIKCGFCGKGMVCVPHNTKGLCYYICYGKRVLKQCPDSGYIPTEEIEHDVWEHIIKIAEGKATLPKAKKIDKTDEINALNEQLKINLKIQDDITELLFDNLIKKDKARNKLEQITRKINNIEQQISELTLIQLSTDKQTPIIKLADVLGATTTKQKHDLLQHYGITVIAQREKRKETTFKIVL